MTRSDMEVLLTRRREKSEEWRIDEKRTRRDGRREEEDHDASCEPYLLIPIQTHVSSPHGLTLFQPACYKYEEKM